MSRTISQSTRSGNSTARSPGMPRKVYYTYSSFNRHAEQQTRWARPRPKPAPGYLFNPCYSFKERQVRIDNLEKYVESFLYAYFIPDCRAGALRKYSVTNRVDHAITDLYREIRQERETIQRLTSRTTALMKRYQYWCGYEKQCLELGPCRRTIARSLYPVSSMQSSRRSLLAEFRKTLLDVKIAINTEGRKFNKLRQVLKETHPLIANQWKDFLQEYNTLWHDVIIDRDAIRNTGWASPKSRVGEDAGKALGEVDTQGQQRRLRRLWIRTEALQVQSGIDGMGPALKKYDAELLCLKNWKPEILPAKHSLETAIRVLEAPKKLHSMKF